MNIYDPRANRALVEANCIAHEELYFLPRQEGPTPMATSINCSDSDKCLACSEDAEPQPFEEEKVLEEMLDAIEEKTNEAFIAHISHEGVLHRALKLAAGVRKLIDIGGGNLRLADGSVWRLFPACAGCENADRMKVDTNRHSKYCPRCANQKLRDHG